MSVPAFTIDFSIKKGPVKALNSVNLGLPLTRNDFPREQRCKELKALRTPFARLHDAPLSNPGKKLVDIPFIFQNFDADESDPSNYYFIETDDYIKGIMETGAEIYYRLGVSIEHTVNSYKTHPPADNEKWAKICANIIRHYNEGWADGFHYNIKYWEIWNEPDLEKKMWTGTATEFFELYLTTSKHLKETFPDLKIGGCGFCQGATHGSYNRPFLERCRENNAPLDFFSWHNYGTHVQNLIDEPYKVREMLDEFGYKDTESHCNEWHYISFAWDKYALDGNYCKTHFDFGGSNAGAAATVATLLGWQDAPLDMAHFYHAGGLSCWGIFDEWGTPNMNYYALNSFAEFLNTTERLDCQTQGLDNLFADAALDTEQERLVILCANTGLDWGRVCLNMKSCPWDSKLHLSSRHIDMCNKLDVVEDITFEESAEYGITIPPLSVVLAELTPVL